MSEDGRAAGRFPARPFARPRPEPLSQYDVICFRGWRDFCGGSSFGYPKAWYSLEGVACLCCDYCSRKFVYDPEKEGSQRLGDKPFIP